MELIYSTNVLTDAESLSSLLTEAGLLNHVSGANSAQLAGFIGSRMSSAIGVWLASASELPRARQVMLANGFLAPNTTKPSSAVWGSNVWVKLAVIAFVALIVAIAAYGS